MTQITTSAPPDYVAALETAALYDEGGAGRIWMRGRDRAELLQRLSTADMLRLRPGQGVRTVLTTPIGRIIDVLTVHALDDTLLLVTSPGQGGAVWSHLKKNIFFQDKVLMEAAGRSHGQLALFGPRAASLLADLTGAALDELPLFGSQIVELAGARTILARRLGIGGEGFSLYIPTEQLEAARTALRNAGAAALGEEAYDILRVEQGYGVAGRELSHEYIPLETGLLDAVSFTKGCYVGQEIIARMESRGRLAKQLRGLQLAIDDAQSIVYRLSSIVPSAKLDVDGKEAGDLTSVVLSPRFGPIALAYVRSAHAAPGTRVGIAGTNVTGEVVELPFAVSQPS
ncbi:MAG TPA: glycine cleavage T C-terminal barrel domain-containing protein [Roseiflexaceae bacterium]|nr:glycine cleavage T C-terminal barrel domain-containing protein [Roseiflexaceae bacterium]